MSFDLTGQLVSSTYGRVVQYVSGSLYDGFGNPVSISGSGNINTGSFATTGSNRFNGNQTITGSLIQGLEGNIATGEYSHAEGSITKAIGNYSHAEGDFTKAIGNYSHAEGQETIASGSYSHAEGYQTIASANWQHVQGQWNATSSVQSAFIVGNGTDNSNRSNLIHAAGNEVQITGSIIFNEGARITPTYYGNTYTGYIDIVAGGPDGFVELLSYNSQSSFYVDDYGAALLTSASYLWQFNNSGSLIAPGRIEAPSFTGSLQGTASYAANADLLDGKNSTIFATTGSNTFIGNQTISGSFILSGSTQYALAYFDTNLSLRTLPTPITSSGDTVAIFVSESNSWIMTNTIDGGTF